MNVSQSIKNSFSTSISSLKNRKGWMYLIIIVLALVAFEAFNFSTTDFALSDLLGNLRFMGVRWATLLALAFCGIDFAGIARLFGPQNTDDEMRSNWFMFGAWILAATMNAILTWWGVVMAMQTHSVLSVSLVNSSFISKFVPIFIALMVWVIRILLIGTLSKQGDKLLREAKQQKTGGVSRREYRQSQSRAAHPSSTPVVGLGRAASARSASRRKNNRPEPTYIPMNDEGAYRTMKASGVTRR
ncbi:hypothetical protein JR338_02035 [Chloroflexota bacterium]|nr:hypothetical protein JR338_02035 [Chloroflexota bacterium]